MVPRPTSGETQVIPSSEAVDRPVFVIGSGRSGLTPLMDLISYHDAFAWPSQYNGRWPGTFRWSLLSRIVEFPPFTAGRSWRGVPKHGEAYGLWNSCFPGFARPFRDLVADDVTPYVRRRFRAAVAGIMKYQGKARFIAEYSGWSRIAFLRSIFPGARFIHIVRDGRAVANSLMNTDWWAGWEGVYKWRWGVPDSDLLERLRQYDFSFLALAAAQWKILVRNICEKGGQLPTEDFIVVRYEDLVAAPHREAQRCLDFCDIEPGPRFANLVDKTRIVDANTETYRIPPWRENLTHHQIEMLRDLIGEELGWFGYL